MFPPISAKHVPAKKLYSDNMSRMSGISSNKMSKLSSISNAKLISKNKRFNRRASENPFPDSDGAMSLTTLKKRRDIKVKSLSKKPTNKIERRAFKNLEKLSKKKRRKEKIKQYETQQQRAKEEREKILLKNEIERRKLVLGVQSTNEYLDGFKQTIFDIGDPEVQRYEKWLSQIKKDVELFDFDEEEYRDRQGVILYVKKFSKLLKFLFSKYANSGHSIKDISNFDNLNKKAQTINVPEL